MDMGEWKQVLPTMHVSSLGYIKCFNKRHQKWLHPYKPTVLGKDRSKFMHNGTTYFLAQEVCTAFHGPRPSPRCTVDHINRDCHDDREANLRWATPSEQAKNRTFTKHRKRWDNDQASRQGEVWVTVGNRRFSNLGRAQFMNSFSKTKWNPVQTPQPCRNQKYATIKNESFHRLIAIIFIGPSPGPEYTVDHINRDKTDNRACNLRWATRVEQNANRAMIKAPTRLAIPILAFDDTKDDWVRYQSAGEAARQLSSQHGVCFWPADILRAAKQDRALNDVNIRFASQEQPSVRGAAHNPQPAGGRPQEMGGFAGRSRLHDGMADDQRAQRGAADPCTNL